MAPARLRTVIDYLRALRPRLEERDDVRLLDRFVAVGDEAAFAALVHRHGPMVFAVCRRVLGNAHDAEDCFQAVFLVLAHKAASLRNPDRLANWLYGVAHRTALKARGRRVRRRKCETLLVDVPISPSDDLTWRELRPVLDEEIARLPARYRTAVILCYLEGATNAEAARRLGWTRGTVATRLAWARQRLAARLTRRGITLPAGALAALLVQEAAAAAFPVGLAKSTIEASLLFAAGRMLTASATPAAILAKGVLTSMTLTKIQFAALMLLTASVVGVGTGWLVRSMPSGERPQAVAPPAVSRAEADREDGLKQELAALRKELQDVKKSSAPKVDAPSSPREAREPAETQPLLYQGKPANYWLAALRDRDPKFRIKAVEALGSLAQVDHSLISTIITCLKDEDDEVRIATDNELDKLGPLAGEAVPALLQADLWPGFVVSTLKTIDPKGEKAVPAALAALKDTQPHVRRNVAYTLFVFDKAQAHLALDGFMDLVKNGSENEPRQVPGDTAGSYRSLKDTAAIALGQMGPKAREAIPALVEGLRWVSKNIRPGGEPTSAEPFASALKKIDPEGKVAVPLLAKMLADNDGWNRQRACMALCVYGARAKDVLPALLRCVKDEKQDKVLREAVRAIGTMGPAARSAVPDLLQRLQTSLRTERVGSTESQSAIVRTLGVIGPAADAAVPVLLVIVNQQGSDNIGFIELRAAAVEAINKIDPQTAKKAGLSDSARPKKPAPKEPQVSPDPRG